LAVDLESVYRSFLKNYVMPKWGDTEIQAVQPRPVELWLRNSELRLLRWKKIDFEERRLYVGKSKTKAGEGRPAELAQTAIKVLNDWRSKFPDVQPQH
jgi:hypothetical protein